MKTLLLMRHAKSSWKQKELPDHDRPLNERGKHDADCMAQWLIKQGCVPGRIVSSSARRAYDTGCIVSRVAKLAAPSKDERLYDSSPEQYIEVIEGEADSCETLMIIGHNPILEELLETLSGAYTPLPTSAIVRLEIAGASWKGFQEQAITVQAIWRAKEVLFMDSDKKKKKKDKAKVISKKLCSLVKKGCHLDHQDDYLELIDDAKYVCKKCGLPSARKKNLCHPVKFKP